MFIKINLLPQNMRPRKSWMILDYRALLVLIIAGATIFLATYFINIQRKLNQADSELLVWKMAEGKLKATVDLQNEVNKLRVDVGKRIEIIKELTQDSNLRFSTLQHVNNVLPENSWLMRIAETMINNKITYSIEGMSYMKKDVSSFIADLEKYENLDKVSLESIKPAPLEIRDAYIFSIKVDLKSLKPVEVSPANSKVSANAKAPAKGAVKK